MTSPVEDKTVVPGRPLAVAALLKQVPVAESLDLGSDGRLQREGTPHEMNPYCRRAVSKGAEIARLSGGSCTVFTLGPPDAEDALREAVAWGADRGIHLCDPAFAGSDTLATALALRAALVREGPFDLVLVGRNTIDGDTGQVGPELAQLLGLPFACGVRELQLIADTLRLRLEDDDGWEEIELDLPALLSVAERLTEPAKVDPEGRAAVPASKITLLSAADLGPGPWGLAASTTRVGEVRVHRHDRLMKVLSGDVASQVSEAVSLLRDRCAIGSVTPGSDSVAQAVALTGLSPASTAFSEAGTASRQKPTRSGTSGRSIAVLLEPGRDAVSAELLGEAARIASQVSGLVIAIRPEGACPGDLGALGADVVIDLGGIPLAGEVAACLIGHFTSDPPWLVVAPSTSFGREVASRVAAALGAGLVGDAVGLQVSAGRVVAAKPAFAGALVADITCTSEMQMVTVRPGVLRPPAPEARAGTTRSLELGTPGRITRLSVTRDDDVEVLALADCVVGVGMGVAPDEYDALRPLCSVLGAELGATRKVTDSSWMPRARQIGLTGRSIAPRLYVAIGLSGKFNHTVGVRSAGTVLAVNSDPGALVFGHCDVGIVADWHEAVPLLAAALAAS